MPHSSGGGSHGGGSHHSSSHSSSGGGSGVKRSRRYFPGSHRYVYYRDSHPIYYYSNSAPPRKKKKLVPRLILSGVALLAVNAFLFWCDFRNPKKLVLDYPAEARVMDEAGIIPESEERELTNTLREFLDLTGISPVVLTGKNEDWMQYYSSMENYAYDRYVNLFDDEKHWLIVYTEPGSASGNFNDWNWEGMQGNDTDYILYEEKTADFTDHLHKLLLKRSDYSVAGAIDGAFRYIMPDLMKPGFTMDGMTTLLMGNAIGLFLIGSMVIGVISNNKLVGAERCATDQGVSPEDTCEYCGGVYVHGIHLSCPHCGAAIKPMKQGYPAGFGTPNQSYAGNEGYPNQGYAGNAGYPNQGYAGNAGYPNQGFAGNTGYPNQGYPGNTGYPNQGFAGNAGYPNQNYQGNTAYPNQNYPGANGDPNQIYPGNAGYQNQNYPGNVGYPNQNYPGNTGYPNQSYPGGPGYPNQNYPGGS